MSGLFITFEGVEGAGKTTQITLLRDALTDRGLTVFATREPGGDPVAEAIRSVLLSADNPVSSRTELLLFLAARAQVVERVIRPRLESGEIVLCDRFIDSTTAYQGYARGHDLEWVRRLNEFATGGLTPDLTILLDLDVSEGLRRQQDHNRMEAQSLEFHQKVRDGFLALAAAEPERFVVLDARSPQEEIHQRIWLNVRNLLAQHSVSV